MARTGEGERERGASAVEFALIAALLFVILFGVVQFGIAFNRSQGLHAAAREGARIGSLPETTIDQIVDRVRSSVSIVDPASLSYGCPATLAVEEGCITVTPGGTGTDQPCNLRSGQKIAVEVKYRMRLNIPLWGTPAITLSGAGEFRCE